MKVIHDQSGLALVLELCYSQFVLSQWTRVEVPISAQRHFCKRTLLRTQYKFLVVFFIMAKKLYVGGLNYDTTEDAFKAAFAQAGNVVSVSIISDRETGRSRGFGFVEFENDDDAAKAIEMWDGQELDGRRLKVNEARPQRSKF